MHGGLHRRLHIALLMPGIQLAGQEAMQAPGLIRTRIVVDYTANQAMAQTDHPVLWRRAGRALRPRLCSQPEQACRRQFGQGGLQGLGTPIEHAARQFEIGEDIVALGVAVH